MVQCKKRIFQIIQSAEKGDIASKLFDVGLIILICINVVSVIIETFNIPNIIVDILGYIEIISTIIFTIEYILRVWTSDFLYPSINPVRAKIKFIFSFLAIIDLLAILPFYIPFIIPVDLRVLRIVRIIRIFRLFKISRYTMALSTIAQVFKNKASQLLSSLFVVSLLLIIASILMYNFENPVQPDVFVNAFSGLWWAVATLTTVGYGDIYPVTVIGKILSAVIAILGIGLVAVPTGIISAGFMEYIQDEKTNNSKQITHCPYCGENIEKFLS